MIIDIDSRWCKGCGLCIYACKQDVLDWGTERAASGHLFPFAKNPDKCIACRQCERFCPDMCISITKE